MNELNFVIKKYRIPLAGAILQWIVTTFLKVDKLFFDYNAINSYYCVVKGIYLLFLIAVWCFVYNFILRLKEGDIQYRRGFWIFGVYFSIMMIILFLIWPGTWALDDIRGLEVIHDYESFYPWQHILTGIYQDVLLQILPFPGGIIILQNAVVSVCVAFVIVKFETVFSVRSFKNIVVDTVIKLLPFLLPPVLSYQFSGYRMGIYVYLELTMLIIIVCELERTSEIPWPDLFLTAFLTALCSTWRSESILYLPCVCILILIAKVDKISKRKKKTALIMIGFLFYLISSWESLEFKNDNYKIMSLCRPCVELIRTADPVVDSMLLDEINRVIDIDVVYSNPDIDGERLYWDSDLVKKWYSKEDYHCFLKAFIGLAEKYPRVVISERIGVFIWGTGIRGITYNNIPESAVIFDADNDYWPADIFRDYKWAFNSPVSLTLRKVCIYAMGCRKWDGNIVKILHLLIWNAVFPILILIYAWIDLLVRKKWKFLFLCSAVLVKLPIIFLTQPSAWFMYLLSFYFLGYVYFIYRVILKAEGGKCFSW